MVTMSQDRFHLASWIPRAIAPVRAQGSATLRCLVRHLHDPTVR